MLCIVNVIRELLRFVIAFRSVNGHYESSTARTLLTMLSIAYILTIIFCGV